jgi:hypothetical protein
MSVREREKSFLETLAERFRSVIKAMSDFSTARRRPENVVAATSSPPVAEVYQQQIVADPEKHIEELAAARKPYANVPFDMID